MKETPELPRPGLRGRPTREDAALLRRRIHQAALDEFLRQGYAGSTIDGIARASGVSRTTIYALYGDKKTLFIEMLRATVRGPNLSKRVAFDDRPPEIILREALRLLNASYHRESNLRIFRLCISEADRFPELAESLCGVLSFSLTGLISYLVRLREEGRLLVDDCEATARLLNMLALGTMKPLFLPAGKLSDGDRFGHLDMALNIFLRGILRDPPSPTGRAAAA